MGATAANVVVGVTEIGMAESGVGSADSKEDWLPEIMVPVKAAVCESRSVGAFTEEAAKPPAPIAVPVVSAVVVIVGVPDSGTIGVGIGVAGKVCV